MSTFLQGQRRARLVKRNRNRKGLQMQRADGLYDTDGLSRSILNSPGDKTTHSISQNIQAKLSVGTADDVYEKEADSKADKVMNAAEPTASTLQKQEEEEEVQTKPLLQRQEEEEEELQAKPLLQRQEEEEEELQAKPLLQRQEEEEEELQAKPLLQKQEEEEEELQAKPLLQKQEEEEAVQAKIQKKESSPSNTVALTTSNRINSRKGMGNSMGEPTRVFMETQFNRDFSAVRIHNDKEANGISQSLNAQAFALDKDIYFNAGKYNPETKQGKHLLAHELTHVVQQNHSLKKKLNPEVQRKCKPAPKKVHPKVKFKMSPVIKNNSAISSFGRTHNNQVKIISNKIKFTEKQICGVCGPKNDSESWVVYPAKADIKASIPVSINKAKINKAGVNGERNYIDKKNVMHTGFYTATDASNKMISPALISYGMTKRHELHHVSQIENQVRNQLKSRHLDIGEICPYTSKKGNTWKKMMQGGWSGTVTWYSEHAANSRKQEKAARKHSF